MSAPGERDRLPGLGALLRNEALKTRHRVGFWAALLFFLLFIFLAVYGPFHATLTGESTSFVLPDAWPTILLGPGPLGGLFGATALILLISSEWAWKTARQNVIDGLSRQEWFAGKLLLWLAVGLVFYGGQVVLAGGMAAFTTGFRGGLVGGGDLLMMAAGLLLILGYLGTGFLTSFLTRSSGAAIGLFFLWIFGEELIGSFLANFDGWRGAVARFRPHAVINALADRGQYDPEVRQATIDRAVAVGREAPEYFATPALFLMVVAWMAVFALAAWLVYRRRDL